MSENTKCKVFLVGDFSQWTDIWNWQSDCHNANIVISSLFWYWCIMPTVGMVFHQTYVMSQQLKLFNLMKTLNLPMHIPFHFLARLTKGHVRFFHHLTSVGPTYVVNFHIYFVDLYWLCIFWKRVFSPLKVLNQIKQTW